MRDRPVASRLSVLTRYHGTSADGNGVAATATEPRSDKTGSTVATIATVCRRKRVTSEDRCVAASTAIATRCGARATDATRAAERSSAQSAVVHGCRTAATAIACVDTWVRRSSPTRRTSPRRSGGSTGTVSRSPISIGRPWPRSPGGRDGHISLEQHAQVEGDRRAVIEAEPGLFPDRAVRPVGSDEPGRDRVDALTRVWSSASRVSP